MSDDQKKLVEDNQKLVYFIIHKYFPTYTQNEDVIQEGMVGLCQAAINYDETICQFSTFASKCILNAILQWFKLNNKHNGTLSLDYPVNNGDGESIPFGDLLVGGEDIEYIDYVPLFDGISERDKRVLILLSKGYDTVEVGEMLGTSKQNVYRIKRKYEKRWRNHLGND